MLKYKPYCKINYAYRYVLRYPNPLYSSTRAPLIIFSAWCTFLLLMVSFSLPSVLCVSIFFGWLSMSSNSSSRMAVTVLEGVVTGMLILTFLPWQVTTLPESVLSLLVTSSFGLPSLPDSLRP